MSNTLAVEFPGVHRAWNTRICWTHSQHNESLGTPMCDWRLEHLEFLSIWDDFGDFYVQFDLNTECDNIASGEFTK